MASGTIMAAVGETPNATEPTFSPSWSTSSSALRNSACAARARARNARPGWVRTTPVGVLWRSRACSSASRPRTLRGIAGCDTPSFRAAARMPPDSTTATQSRIWLSRMMITVRYRAYDDVILRTGVAPWSYLFDRASIFPYTGRKIFHTKRPTALESHIADLEVSDYERQTRGSAVVGGIGCNTVLFPS